MQQENTEGNDIEKSEELQEFIKTTIDNIEKGMPKGYHMRSLIDFELVVVNVKEATGGVKLFVVDASGKYNKEATSRIKFSIGEG